MATITEIVARKRGELDAKVRAHNEIVEELNVLRGQDSVDEALVSEKKARKEALYSEIDALRAEVLKFEAEERADAEIARLQGAVSEVRAEKREDVVEVVREANPVYRKDSTEVSYFRDLFEVSRGSSEARERLARSQETRAATTVGGAGGEFAPPAWLVEDFVALARAGRITADLANRADLPEGISSVNLPKVTANTDPAVVQTQNTTITEASFTTTSVSSGITEISGKQTVSLALLRQSGVPIDQVILSDLAQGYAVTLDQQVISGSAANGQLRGLITAGTTVTYTTTTPAVVSTTAANSFYNKILSAQSTMNSTRFLPADAIVMHPRRWSWVLSALDGNSRPLVTPNGAAYNQVAAAGQPVAEGFAGEMLGLPVYVDPNIPTNLGAATNQDVVFVLRTSDLWLWESAVETASFDATLAAQNSILFRVLGFAAFIPHRHQASVQVISGTGLVAPSFA